MLDDRKISAPELAEACLTEIRDRDGNLGCFLAVDEDSVRTQAAEAQSRIDSGNTSFLTGIPVALKDNLSTTGLPTTCASKILEGYQPPFDATVVSRIRNEGGLILGKTNMDEFAMGTSTETSAYQLTRNPWDSERSPGGSSGGSAAAVAGLMAPLALGSDTGGSIRQPAALCGVVGFKPSYGRCSRYGLVAFGSSLDQIGPFARSVEDAAQLAAVITGHDRRDATSIPTGPISTSDLKTGSLRGVRFAVPTEMMGGAVSSGVRAGIEEAIKAMEAEGAVFEEISLPATAYGVTTYYIIAPAEASSNLARFDGIRYGPRLEGKGGHIDVVAETRGRLFGHEVKQRIMIGTYALSAGYYDAYYVKAQAVRAKMTAEYNEAFSRFDAILGPTSPITAFKIGELNSDPLALKVLDICTIPANMGGFPAISLNCGFENGLPIGLQLVGPHMADERVLQLAHAVERTLPNACLQVPVP
ncbi:MAG: Glutamyl-tRNA(Gln) amidotransferase subunit A [Fimbriimonadaceae bacterium]|nr:Glutamyl-tRNA(Gln) amidotransferase subunit A [Fimbriimonadaceae bacterium]